MATKTTNYNLIKPELTDDADIRVINGNMDVLDNQLKSISDKANDVNNKLPLTGGTMTGAIKTADNIYKNSNNGTLVLSGSTDALHGGRIDLSGEKHTDAGCVKITADNGTLSNVFEVTTAGSGSHYNFNGLTTYMNSNDDYFRFGDDDAYFRFDKGKQLHCNTERINLSKTTLMSTDTDVFKVGEGNDPWFAINRQYNKLFYSPQGTQNGYEIPYVAVPLSFDGTQSRENGHAGYIKFNNGLLIQWGLAYYTCLLYTSPSPRD